MHPVASRQRPAFLERISRAKVVLSAFVASRLIVLAAGASSVWLLPSHLSSAGVHDAVQRRGAVGYLLTATVDRWDSAFYLAIASHGYGPSSSGRLAFFPAYPLLIKALSLLVHAPLLCAIVISLGSFLTALLMLHRLTDWELGRRAADATVLLVAFAPLSFFFSAVYTESLFLAVSVGALLAARTGRWRLACALAAVATLTRVTGIILLLALAVMRIRERRRADLSLLWLGAVPIAFGAYMAALAVNGYSALGMITSESTWHRLMVGPVAGLALGLLGAVMGVVRIVQGAPVFRFNDAEALSMPAENLVLMLVLALALAALVVCWRRLPPQYSIYAGFALMLCVSSPLADEPLTSVDRYIVTIFPLFMAAGAWIAERRLQAMTIGLSSVLLVFYSVQFATYAFVA